MQMLPEIVRNIIKGGEVYNVNLIGDFLGLFLINKYHASLLDHNYILDIFRNEFDNTWKLQEKHIYYKESINYSMIQIKHICFGLRNYDSNYHHNYISQIINHSRLIPISIPNNICKLYGLDRLTIRKLIHILIKHNNWIAIKHLYYYTINNNLENNIHLRLSNVLYYILIVLHQHKKQIDNQILNYIKYIFLDMDIMKNVRYNSNTIDCTMKLIKDLIYIYKEHINNIKYNKVIKTFIKCLLSDNDVLNELIADNYNRNNRNSIHIHTLVSKEKYIWFIDMIKCNDKLELLYSFNYSIDFYIHYISNNMYDIYYLDVYLKSLLKEKMYDNFKLIIDIIDKNIAINIIRRYITESSSYDQKLIYIFNCIINS